MRNAVLLDSMAERYSMLPSEVLERATTQDLHIFDVALTYKEYMQKKQTGNQEPTAIPDSDELLKRYADWQEKVI